ncbi:MAG: hypothetical protein AAF909_06670 [Pseudomonadota bacterium]
MPQLHANTRSAARAAVASGDDVAPPRSQWIRRWRMIQAILGFCALLGAYIIIAGPDDRLRETAFLGLLALSASVALGYLGFATQDDRNWLRAVGEGLGRRAAQPPCLTASASRRGATVSRGGKA